MKGGEIDLGEPGPQKSEGGSGFLFVSPAPWAEGREDFSFYPP